MKEKQMGQRICRVDNKCSIVTIAFTPGKNPPPPPYAIERDIINGTTTSFPKVMNVTYHIV